MLTKADRTKQFIIEKAAPLFNSKGYAATSMSDILKATGLAKGGIYGNFESKDAIAVAAFEYAYNKMKEAIVFKIRQEKTASAKLLALLDFYRNYTVNPLIEGGCPLLNTAIDADGNIPMLKQRAGRALREMLDSLEHIIRKGIEYGEFDPALDPAKEALLFFGVVEGGIMMSKASDNPKMLNSLLEYLKEQVQTKYKK